MSHPLNALIRASVADNIETANLLLKSEETLQALEDASERIIASCRSGGMIFAIGNGGSAADAQHLVGNLVGRFAYDRPPLRAQALTTNSSALTCIGNDYGYEDIFARQIWASGRKGDVLIALSTSGNSENVVRAVEKARELSVFTIGMTGSHGGRLSELCDITLRAPSKIAARIQETHILMAHAICQRVEAEIFPRENNR